MKRRVRDAGHGRNLRRDGHPRPTLERASKADVVKMTLCRRWPAKAAVCMEIYLDIADSGAAMIPAPAAASSECRNVRSVTPTRNGYIRTTDQNLGAGSARLRTARFCRFSGGKEQRSVHLTGPFRPVRRKRPWFSKWRALIQAW